MANEPKKTIKDKITSIVNGLVDVVAILLALWLVMSGYLYLVLAGLLIYSIYVVWKGWAYIETMFAMIDGLVFKYRKSKEMKKNGLSKDRHRT